MGKKPSTRDLLRAYKACKQQGIQGDDFMACIVRYVREEKREKG